MANKQIYELTTRTFDGDSLIPISVENTDPSTSTQYPQLAGKASGNDIADFVANDEQYTTDLDTEAKTITGSINELHSSIGAEPYDENETYNKGDTVIHNGTLYACKDNSVTGTWNASHWDDTTLQPKTDNTLSTTDKTVVGAINELNTDLTPNPISITNVETSSMTINDNTSYSIGDLVVVNIRFTVSTNINGGRLIINGLPKSTTTLGSGTSFMALSSSRQANGFTVANYSDDAGVITMDTLTAQTYCISGTYIKA